MKKGFTLVEILAVIAILALITLVSIPTVNRLLERNKFKAYETSVKGLVKAVKNDMEADNYKVPRKYSYIGDTVMDNSECKECEKYYDSEYYNYVEEPIIGTLPDNYYAKTDSSQRFVYYVDGLTLDSVGTKIYHGYNLPIATSGNIENSYGLFEYNSDMELKVQIMSKSYCAYKAYDGELEIGKIKNNTCVINDVSVAMDFDYPTFNKSGFLVVTRNIKSTTTRFVDTMAQ